MAAFARLINDLHLLFTNADPKLKIGINARDCYDLGFIGFTLFAIQFTETTEEILVVCMFMNFVALLFTGIPVAGRWLVWVSFIAVWPGSVTIILTVGPGFRWKAH